MKTGIWKNVLNDKYYPHFPVWTWIRSVELLHQKGSQTWKNLCNTLPIILRWMAWKPGRGHSIILGKDVILGIGQGSILSNELVQSLNQKNIYFLYQATTQASEVGTRKRWISNEDLDLTLNLVEEWNNHRPLMVESGISLDNKLDKLIWTRGDSSGVILVKNIYEALSNQLWKKIQEGWRKKLWKWDCPLKIKLFIWLLEANKVLSWKNLQKRGWQGPGICIMCKNHSESTKHIFLTCPFSRSVWVDLKKALALDYGWNGVSVAESLKNWAM
jgi:hypothetical protein